MTDDCYLIGDAFGTIQLRPGDLKIIGRDESSDIVLMDRLVSRRHARIFWDGVGFVLEDLRSRNGTHVGAERITLMQLVEGTVFQIGPFSVTFREGATRAGGQGEHAGMLETITGGSVGLQFGESGFAGDLATLNIAEVFQTLQQNCKSGCLTVKARDLKAQVYFDGGDIVHARAGIYMDREAVFQVLALREGAFDFKNDAPPPASTMRVATMAVLLEALRRSDEMGRDQAD